MPTKLEIKRLNNSKNSKVSLENKLADLDPNCEEYANVLRQINNLIVVFSKRLNVCISKKLLNADEISNYKNMLNINFIPNRFVIEQKRLEEERIRREDDDRRRMEEERIANEERSRKNKIKAKLRRRR